MKLLVIGGGRFAGRHLVDAALARGDSVTLFNRGRSEAEAPAGAEHRIGDRRADLSALATGQWDAVVDFCGYLPAEVARMAELLHGRVGRYAFVSSVSVYAGFATPNDESSPLGRIDDADTEVVDGRTYGPLKALCEAAVRERFGAQALIVRPGLIVGPRDPTERFTYWPARIAAAAPGEAVLVPGSPADALQVIDGRDLAAFMLHALAQGTTGTFNAVTPPGRHDFGELMRCCIEAAGSAPRLVWADAAQIAAAGLEAWSDLPAWLPAQGDDAAFAHCDSRRAQAAGLDTRPLLDTVRDTLAWYRALPADARAFTKAGLTPDREAAALAAIGAR